MSAGQERDTNLRGPRTTWSRLVWAWRVKEWPWLVPREVRYIGKPTDADVAAAEKWAVEMDRRAVEAAQEYIRSQNHWGYEDGDERCRDARIALCEALYVVAPTDSGSSPTQAETGE